MNKFYWVALMAGVCAVMTGCGEPDFYRCSGVVRHEGEPVPFLQITFSPTNPEAARPPIAFSDAEGKFEMTSGREYGVPPGTYTIYVEDPGAADGRQTSKEPGYLYVIDRYSPQKSDIKYEADQHRTDFELNLDTKAYTGPPVRKFEMKNTTGEMAPAAE